MRPQLRMPFCAALSCAFGLLIGCAEEAGEPPDYSDQLGLVPEDDPTPPPDPNPYQTGDARLAFGKFYEGGRSETISINGVTTNYFVFEESFTEGASNDQLEGRISDEIKLKGPPFTFWGGGFVYDEPFDLSEWTTMYVGFKSSDPSFASFNLTLQSGEPPTDARLNPTAYGYTNDGEWHFLRIPLQDAIDRGFDPTMVRSPFIVAAPGGTAGDVLLVDSLYFTKD